MADVYGVKGRYLEAEGLGKMADVRFYGGPSSHTFDGAKFANGSLIGEKCYFGKMRSNSVILPRSTLYFGAFGTNCALNIGDVNDDDALATLINVASGGNSPFLEAITMENAVKPLWQLLNYASDPDKMIDLYGSIAGANVSTTTAWLTWDLAFGRG